MGLCKRFTSRSVELTQRLEEDFEAVEAIITREQDEIHPSLDVVTSVHKASTPQSPKPPQPQGRKSFNGEKAWGWLVDNLGWVCIALAPVIVLTLIFACLSVDNPATADSTDDTDSAWVTAAILWPEKFQGRKGPNGLDRFREKHPEMFRNPTRYKLEIHAGRWVTYWHELEQKASDSLGEPPESIADDPEAQTEFLEGAADRIAKLRAEKKAGQ